MKSDTIRRILLTIITAITLWFVIGGVNDETSRPFLFRFAAFGVVVWLMAFFMPADRLGRAGPTTPLTAAQRARSGRIALLCGGGALAVFLGYPWEPRTDFDMIGFLWMVQNGPAALVVFVLGSIAAVGAVRYFWGRG